MNCVVVGGGGFIGSHLSEAIMKLRNRITILDLPDASHLELLSQKGATIVLGDIRDVSILEKSFSGADTVFHLASTTIPKSSIDDPVFDVSSNLIGSINLLNAAKNTGVKKVVFISSGGTVYGIPKIIPITEDHPTDPISSYGIIKLAIEKYMALFQTLYGLDYTIIRVSNAYGERQSAIGVQGIIPTLIYKALQRQEITIWGDGNVIRDYIHVSDIVNALLEAANHVGEPYKYNIGSGIGHSVNDIVRMLERVLGESLKLIYKPGRAYDVPVNILDNSLARQVLHWEPQVSLSDGIRQTLEYLRDH